jgi:hypothetical protein
MLAAVAAVVEDEEKKREFAPTSTPATAGTGCSVPEHPDEDVRTFIREHSEAGYWSRPKVEREMDIEDDLAMTLIDER